VIKVEGLSKSFKINHEKNNSLYSLIRSIGKHQNSDILTVLDNISFEVKRGEIVGVLGRNGSGKSTLLKLISRILNPDSGRIIVNGEITPFLEIGTGFNGEMSAIDNIIIYGMIIGFSRSQIKSKIDTIIEFADLKRFEDTKLKHFSAGMYARLAFSTAIQINPDIMLVDEIFSVGDISFRKKSFDVFSKFKEDKKSILLVSHDPSTIHQLCNRVLVLEKGKIIFDGNTEDGIKKYQEVMNSG